MMWKGIGFLVGVFWVVMTGLLVRNVYFPDHTRMAEVPVKLVLERFVSQTSSNGSVLHLYQGDERIGHLNVHTSKGRSRVDEGTMYRMVFSGSVDDKERKERGHSALSWRVELDLREAEVPERLQVEVMVPATEHVIHLGWKQGEKMPELEIKEAGKVVMDTKGVMAMAGIGQTMGLFKGMMESQGKGGAAAESAVKVTCVEGRIELASRVRSCHVLTLKALERFQVQFVFTEAGELAMVDLPEGFRLLEPFIYGLEPELIEN